MCVPALVFRQKQNTYSFSTESITGALYGRYLLMANGGVRLWNFLKLKPHKKKRGKSLWPASFKTNILDELNLKRRTDSNPKTQ